MQRVSKSNVHGPAHRARCGHTAYGTTSALLHVIMPSACRPAAELSKSKLDVAKEAVQGVLQRLGPGDRVAIVLFSRWALPYGMVTTEQYA